jgi:outer membrane protein TolC
MPFSPFWQHCICLSASFLFLFLGGCRSYAPAPIEWHSETSGWADASSNRVSLTLSEARQCALVLNPAINALRLKHLASGRLALASGWWEDPALDLDGLRVLRGGPHPWIIGSGLSFAIPLSGVPGIEKLAAQAYGRADALAVTMGERHLLAEIDTAWSRAVAIEQRTALTADYAVRITQWDRTVQALVQAGELPKSEGDRFLQERLASQLEKEQLDADASACRIALVRLLGVHPAAQIEFAFKTTEQAPAPIFPDEEALIRHPRVQEKLARLDASEEALRAEIRRQYPDLAIGPSFGHEEGGGRLGLSLGLNLPLWNRNRKGVALAESGRDTARNEALSEWRVLISDLHETRESLKYAERAAQLLRDRRLPEASDSAARIERLFKAGETDVLAVAEAEQTFYQIQRAAIDAQLSVAEARIRVAALAPGNQ